MSYSGERERKRERAIENILTNVCLQHPPSGDDFDFNWGALGSTMNLSSTGSRSGAEADICARLSPGSRLLGVQELDSESLDLEFPSLSEIHRG